MSTPRSRLVDIAVIGAIVLLVGSLVLVQIALRHRDSESRVTPSPSPSGSASIQHSTDGPTPTATTPPALPSATALPSGASTGIRGPQVPQQADPSKALSSLAAKAQENAALPLVFRVATFNVLGASHTTKRGDSRIKTSYSLRMNYAIQVLAAHKADVVGFQEYETPQAKLFTKLVGPVWGLWPEAGGGGADGRNSIGYLKKKWELVKGTSLTIPYFHGSAFRSPVALLRDRSTGREVWFISVHNPATNCAVCGGNNDRWREEAVQKEIAAIRQLHADGTPVVLMGDMNSKDEFYCSMVGSGLGVTFPNPGTVSGTSCVGPRPTTIDWILGTPGMTWAGYVRDRSQLTRLATDHPVYSATAIVP
ncbi:endonuclease/exonuclease/phosphatase family protein [Nocardioides sp. Kera G14]|uniref:endonuclease/exonuclease/phosphatase family protein n=1 Tax=Nocardioides sp. Kera G14 TaxID=2884264 RepID=UPI001D0FB677|nr:endonuclease/exonuclease/phosphatase family protein [Nocardioides sp. Kera G14]UDY24544.1 endonuclease/exonuclease/phosphatase family protein [Nocardioides sp. Kera G14]